jgi:hypothetical protein
MIPIFPGLRQQRAEASAVHEIVNFVCDEHERRPRFLLFAPEGGDRNHRNDKGAARIWAIYSPKRPLEKRQTTIRFLFMISRKSRDFGWRSEHFYRCRRRGSCDSRIRDQRIVVMLAQDEIDAINQMRGRAPASAFVRGILLEGLNK